MQVHDPHLQNADNKQVFMISNIIKNSLDLIAENSKHNI